MQPNGIKCTNDKTISRLLLSAVMLLLLLTFAASTIDCALKVSVIVPELVKVNDAFWLNCSHQREPINSHEETSSDHWRRSRMADIYAIKWYKDNEEFYRFLPNAEPKVSIYETNGIQLDVSYSK